jgi:hypothetical protein
MSSLTEGAALPCTAAGWLSCGKQYIVGDLDIGCLTHYTTIHTSLGSRAVLPPALLVLLLIGFLLGIPSLLLDPAREQPNRERHV